MNHLLQITVSPFTGAYGSFTVWKGGEEKQSDVNLHLLRQALAHGSHCCGKETGLWSPGPGIHIFCHFIWSEERKACCAQQKEA